MLKIVTPTLAALAFAVSATPAAAEQQKTVRVPYNDLNVSTQAGVATLESRIRAAIRTVCGAPVPRDLRAEQARKRCSKRAQRSADPQLAAVLNKHGSIAFATMLAKGDRG